MKIKSISNNVRALINLQNRTFTQSVCFVDQRLQHAGQQPATQKKQDPSKGKTVSEGDPKKAPQYTTAAAAWDASTVSSQGFQNSHAVANSLWGLSKGFQNRHAMVNSIWAQSKGFYSGAVLGYVKDKHDRPDRGSDVGGIQDGSSDINTGVFKSTLLLCAQAQ